jgi:two-component system, cell cycle sensor histidine kinase and response regulator CckA
MKRSLSMSGYRILTTTNPMNAIELFKKFQKDIALVITDIVMPLIDGGEVIRQIREVRPQTRFLTISGYSKYADASNELQTAELLQKPFDANYLLTAVRRALDANAQRL